MFWKKKWSRQMCIEQCAGKSCPQWVELNHQIKMDDGTIKNVPEGKCAIAWIPTLLVELTIAIKNRTEEKK